MKIEKNDSLLVRDVYDKDYKQEYLIISDVHIDNHNCNKKLLKSHLEEAKEKNAKVFIFGDLFDLMQSRNDPRADKMSLKNRDLQGAYFNQILDEAYEFFEPYKDLIALISYGNHETKITKYAEIDLLKILAYKLGVNLGAYQGFIKFYFNHKADGMRKSYDLFYHHGGGGNSPMTMGVLNHKRLSIWVDADIIVSGHNHESWDYEQIKVKCNPQGFIEKYRQLHIKSATYNEESFNFGFLVEKMSSPRPLGGYWLKFYYKNGIKFKIERTDNEI